MRFIDRKISDLTVAACDAELERAKKAHATYAKFIRTTKGLIEAKANLNDMGADREAGDDG